MSREMLLFINNTSTTEIYTYGHTLSLHDALTILLRIEVQLIESLLQQVKAAVDVADGENSAHIREIVPFEQSAGHECFLLQQGFPLQMSHDRDTAWMTRFCPMRGPEVSNCKMTDGKNQIRKKVEIQAGSSTDH